MQNQSEKLLSSLKEEVSFNHPSDSWDGDWFTADFNLVYGDYYPFEAHPKKYVKSSLALLNAMARAKTSLAVVPHLQEISQLFNVKHRGDVKVGPDVSIGTLGSNVVEDMTRAAHLLGAQSITAASLGYPYDIILAWEEEILYFFINTASRAYIFKGNEIVKFRMPSHPLEDVEMGKPTEGYLHGGAVVELTEGSSLDVYYIEEKAYVLESQTLRTAYYAAWLEYQFLRRFFI